MTLEQALYNYLTGVAGLTALIGTRVYPVALPQGATLPAVVYQRVSGARIRTMGDARLARRPRIQFTVWAATYASRLAVGAQLVAALDGYTPGTMGGAGGVDVLDVVLDNEIDDHEPTSGAYQGVLDFIVTHHGD